MHSVGLCARLLLLLLFTITCRRGLLHDVGDSRNIRGKISDRLGRNKKTPVCTGGKILWSAVRVIYYIFILI